MKEHENHVTPLSSASIYYLSINEMKNTNTFYKDSGIDWIGKLSTPCLDTKTRKRNPFHYKIQHNIMRMYNSSIVIHQTIPVLKLSLSQYGNLNSTKPLSELSYQK